MKYIYHLERNGIPFYVGQTKAIYNRISSHKATFGDFDFKVVYKCNDGRELVYESFYIWYYSKLGHNLENKSFGAWQTSTNIPKDLIKLKESVINREEDCLSVCSGKFDDFCRTCKINYFFDEPRHIDNKYDSGKISLKEYKRQMDELKALELRYFNRTENRERKDKE